MIENVPSFLDLDGAAKTAFFSGWHELLEILADFDNASPDSEEDEKKQYYSACTNELQSILVLAAQACEIALKARICKVSPYLLLIGSRNSLSTKSGTIDFSGLRTVDAVDLVGTVNTVTAKPVSDAFSNRFSELRKLRNKAMHLGQGNEQADPNEMFDLFEDLYVDLWPQSSFLQDWKAFLEGTRRSYFHDYKWSSPEMEIAEVLRTFYHKTNKSRYSSLFHVDKKQPRFTCLDCYFDGAIENTSIPIEEFQTAVLESRNRLLCFLCGGVSEVEEHECVDDVCSGKLVSGNSANYPGLCQTCGYPQI